MDILTFPVISIHFYVIIIINLFFWPEHPYYSTVLEHGHSHSLVANLMNSVFVLHFKYNFKATLLDRSSNSMVCFHFLHSEETNDIAQRNNVFCNVKQGLECMSRLHNILFITSFPN